MVTFTLVVPNPFAAETWPTAMQYKFDNFLYFFLLLSFATMAYSWRTVFAFATWTSGRVLHLTDIGKALEHELNPCLGDARDRPVYNRNVQGDLFA